MAERPDPRIFRPFQVSIGLATGFVLLFCVFLLPGGVLAQDLYEVTNVTVDESAANEVEAKQIGVVNAKRAAFARLLQRLTLPPEPSVPDPVTGEVPQTTAAPPPVPENDRLEFMIRDVSFVEEKFGGGRYLANLTVRFQASAVNQYLQRSGTAYLGSPSPLAVILPVFRDQSGDQLWSDTNPWLDAWWRLEGKGAVVPYTVPLGDLTDIGAVDAERAVTVDAPSINAIAAQYGAGAVLMPIASLTSDGGVQVTLSTFGAGWPGTPTVLTFNQIELATKAVELLAAEEDQNSDPNAQESQLFAAVALTMEAMESRWKTENILRFDQEAASITAMVDLTNLQEWLAIKAALDRTAPIKEWRLSELSVSRAVVEIDYIGDQDRLNRELARVALGLAAGEDDQAWTLFRR